MNYQYKINNKIIMKELNNMVNNNKKYLNKLKNKIKLKLLQDNKKIKRKNFK